MRLRVGLLATTVLLAAYVSVALARAPRAAPPQPTQACALIGCESGVFFDAGRYFAAHSSVQRVRVCALGRCRSLRRGEPALGRPLVLQVAHAQIITITATAFGPRGRVVLRRRLVAALRKGEPNGPQCKPICFQAEAHLSRDGTLNHGRG